MVAEAHLGLRVVGRGGERLAVDVTQVVRVEQESAARLARLEEQVGTEEDGTGGAEVLVGLAPGRLPVLGREPVQEREGGGEADDRIVLARGGAPARDAVAGRSKHVAGRVIDHDAAGTPQAAAKVRGLVDVERGGSAGRTPHDPAVVRAAVPQASAEGHVDVAVAQRKGGSLLLDAPGATGGG